MNELDGLVRAAQRGESEAFGRIVVRFQNMAYASAYAQLGDFHLAQDAAQEAFIDAYLSLGNLREPAAFPGWFRRFVVKHSDRQLRKTRHLSLDPEEIQAMPSGLPNPEALFMRRQHRQTVREAVAALPERQREAIALFYLEGYSQKEVAQFLGTTVGAVGKRLYDARKGLEKRMQNMVKESLNENKPDESFAARVQFFIALKKGDVAAMAALLDEDATLIHAEADWGSGADRAINPGTTPINWAASTGDEAVIDLLLERGVDINVREKGGNTPLQSAVAAGRHPTARILLAKGADVDARGSCEHTPLHRAVMRGDEEMVELLLEGGADIEAGDFKGQTAADWAALKGRRRLGDLLVERGAKASSIPVRGSITRGAPMPGREVPVGDRVLGRMVDADGGPLDGGDVFKGGECRSICGSVGETVSPIFETGIKAVDVAAPFKRGGHVGLDSCFGVGKLLMMTQIAHNAVAHRGGRIVYLGITEGDPTVQHKEWREVGCEGKHLGEHIAYVLAQPDDSVSRRRQTVETGLAMAENFRRQGCEVLLMVEGRLALTEGVIPYLRTHVVATPEAAVTTLYLGDAPLGLEEEAFAFLDAFVAFDGQRAKAGLYPAVDVHRSRSLLLQDSLLTATHRETVEQVRQCLGHY
ncbi:MAG: sigma-70 family RNA polymerase sigma factor, partial [Gemmatimonadetes bacterium]|nr:sigma-70 family RNA polymerase sigma factor [Gemmatimonadota bacterium]